MVTQVRENWNQLVSELITWSQFSKDIRAQKEYA